MPRILQDAAAEPSCIPNRQTRTCQPHTYDVGAALPAGNGRSRAFSLTGGRAPPQPPPSMHLGLPGLEGGGGFLAADQIRSVRGPPAQVHRLLLLQRRRLPADPGRLLLQAGPIALTLMTLLPAMVACSDRNPNLSWY